MQGGSTAGGYETRKWEGSQTRKNISQVFHRIKQVSEITTAVPNSPILLSKWPSCGGKA